MYYDSLRRRVDAAAATLGRRREAQALLDSIDVTTHEADVYRPLHDDIQRGGHTTYYLPGGRGSCKSSFVSLELIDGIMKDPAANGIVFRAVGATLRDSVFTQCLWAADVLGVAHLWKARVSPMQLTYTPTGQVIIFRGLDDPLKLKSIRPPHGRFKYIWFEELCELSGRNKLRSVLQSVMRGGEGFRVFGSFNPPISRSNWCNVLVDEPDPRAITFRTDYTQVPAAWLGADFVAEAERIKELNPKIYEHEYMGVPVGAGGEVFTAVEVREITDDEIAKFEHIFMGCDFGFSRDPAAVIRAAYDRKTEKIYLIDELYKRRCSNADIAAWLKDKGYHKTGKIGYINPLLHITEMEKQLIYCDSAEPKSIQDLVQLGIKAAPCYKAPGAVQYRIKWLQRRTIVIDPKRTPAAYKEFTEYEYETTRDGEFTSELPDKNNHTIDGLCYALTGPIFYTKGETA